MAQERIKKKRSANIFEYSHWYLKKTVSPKVIY